MSLVKWTLIGLLVLPAAELLAFFLMAALVGWLWAAGLFIATSIVGVLLLRRFGRADLDRLRAAFARDGVRALHLETPGVATMAAKFPTFARSSRRTPRDDGVIELEPGEWHQIPDRGRRRRRKSKRGA